MKPENDNAYHTRQAKNFQNQISIGQLEGSVRASVIREERAHR
jgi:hypothetical protein